MPNRSDAELAVTVSWFETCTDERRKAALGEPEHTSWENLAGVLSWSRRVSASKDGPAFALTRFAPHKADPKRVRRVTAGVIARTGLVLDIETNKATNKPAPPMSHTARKLRGKAAVVYSSYTHTPALPRYRVVVPLSAEIDPLLPAPEILAERLGLTPWLDRSKITPASVFYLPACPPDTEDMHEAIVLQGVPLDASKVTAAAAALQAQRDAEQAAQSEAAHRRALEQRQARGGDNTLIEQIRPRLGPLDQLLLAHGYDRRGRHYRHPNSMSGSFGADIQTFGGVERVYSHNGTDPLHRENLPAWCGVTALDAFDVATILDFAGDRTRALRELSQQFGLDQADQRKAVIAAIYRSVKGGLPQHAIEAAAYAEGERQGLSRAEVDGISRYLANKPRAAA